MTNLETEILYYIKTWHKGKANAITFKKLSLALDIGSRTLRKTVSGLVNSTDAFIGSSSKCGYFYIDNKDELMDCYKELRKKGLAELFRARRLLRNEVFENQPEKFEQERLISV